MNELVGGNKENRSAPKDYILLECGRNWYRGINLDDEDKMFLLEG